MDQLILTVGQDLFGEPAELALAHQFAVVLRGYADANPAWRLGDLVAELQQVASNPRRKFLSLAHDDNAFDAGAHRGEVVVATMHRAKGLEWDRVYLTALNNYDFPGGQAHDVYRGERWYLRDSLNLTAEALAQLAALGSGASYVEGEASRAARLEYVEERLRLLYVGITRARRDLILTWNTGRRREPCQRAVAFIALQALQEQT